MDNFPSISIITPVFNREDCIIRCLDSVTAQYEWIDQHIVVDDGSSDQTANLVENYCRNHTKVKLFRMPKNSGTNAARNYGISHIASEFTMILDSDDMLNTGAMCKIHEVMRQYPQYHHYMFAASDMMPLYEKMPLLHGKKIVELSFANALCKDFSGDFIHVILTDTMKKFPFDEKTRIFEGVNFLRFYRDAGKFLYCNSVAVNRDRGREDSVTRSAALVSTDALIRAWRAVKLRYDYFHDDYKAFAFEAVLQRELKVLCILSVALGQYDCFRMVCGELADRRSRRILRILSICRSGMLLRWLIIVKYRFFTKV